jgi:predicted RNase H-like HicB family nuclease
MIIERHPNGNVAHPVEHHGVVVAEGSTVEAALANVESAIRFQGETLGPELETYV